MTIREVGADAGVRANCIYIQGSIADALDALAGCQPADLNRLQAIGRVFRG